MDTTSIKSDVRQFIAENFPLSNDAFALEEDDSLIETGVIDSTGVLEVIGFVEDRYSIEVADAEVLPENLDSINNIASFVTSKLAASPNGRPAD